MASVGKVVFAQFLQGAEHSSRLSKTMDDDQKKFIPQLAIDTEFFHHPVRFCFHPTNSDHFLFDLSKFWNKQGLLLFYLYKLFNKQGSLCFNLSKFCNKRIFSLPFCQ
jgi:hypothetical protein